MPASPLTLEIIHLLVQIALLRKLAITLATAIVYVI